MFNVTHEVAGFSSIAELFDAAYSDQVLYAVDLFLREKAITNHDFE